MAVDVLTDATVCNQNVQDVHFPGFDIIEEPWFLLRLFVLFNLCW